MQEFIKLMFTVTLSLSLIYLPFLILRWLADWLHNSRLRKAGIYDIDYMDGIEFEHRLKVLFKDLGYKVTRTKSSGDYGADLIITKDGISTAVQAKRYEKNVGVSAVQEVLAAKEYYRCQRAMVVTNSRFTNSAYNMAKRTGVILWGRRRLVDALLDAQKDQRVAPGVVEEVAAAEEEEPEKVYKCAFCGEEVPERVANYCLARRERFKGKVYCMTHQRDF